MSNRNFKNEIEKAEEFQKELKSRLDLSRQIIGNLYRKHFHNYGIRMNNVFGWMQNKAVVVEGRLSYLDSKTGKYVTLSSIYYSNDVRGIAKQARKEFYKAIQQQANDVLSRITREIQTNKQKLDYHQKVVNANNEEQVRQRKLIARTSGRKTKNRNQLSRFLIA